MGTKITAGSSPTLRSQKSYQMQASLVEVIELPFLMVNAGKFTSISSNGITTIQYKINSGTYATPSYGGTGIAYSAGDVIWLTWAYSDLNSLKGNIILIGTDV